MNFITNTPNNVNITVTPGSTNVTFDINMVVPPFEPTKAPDYIVGQMIMDNGQVYIVTSAPAGADISNSAQYTALGGNASSPTGATGGTGDSGATGATDATGSTGGSGDTGLTGGTGSTGSNEPLPSTPQTLTLSSGSENANLAVGIAGAVGLMSYVGNDQSMESAVALGNSIDLGAAANYAVPVSGNGGTVDSLSVTYSLNAGLSVSLGNITVVASLYYAASGATQYTEIASAHVALDPAISGFTVNLFNSTELSGSASGINFHADPGSELLLVFATEPDSSIPGITVVAGPASATVNII
jgi:hypothetical protein